MTAAFVEPPYGRRESFDKVKDLLLRKTKPTIVEIGCLRTVGDVDGDGYSSALFAYIANVTEGKLISIDHSSEAIATWDRVLTDLGLRNRCMAIVMDGVAALKDWPSRNIGLVDCLYLDGPDPTNPTCASFHLECLQLIEPYFGNEVIVVIDDVLNASTFAGKGNFVIPYLLSQGYTTIYRGYQFVFQRPQ